MIWAALGSRALICDLVIVLFASGGAVKLAHFGLAKILDNGIQQAVSFVGVNWLAPQC